MKDTRQDIMEWVAKWFWRMVAAAALWWLVFGG